MRNLTDEQKTILYRGILVEFNLQDSEENREYFREACGCAEHFREIGEYMGHEVRDNFLDYSGLGEYT